MQHENGHRIRTLDLIDTQAGGDVSRIVMGGVGDRPGERVRSTPGSWST